MRYGAAVGAALCSEAKRGEQRREAFRWGGEGDPGVGQNHEDNGTDPKGPEREDRAEKQHRLPGAGAAVPDPEGAVECIGPARVMRRRRRQQLATPATRGEGACAGGDGGAAGSVPGAAEH